MHHPGKVIRVFSPADADVIASDSSTQVMISMWDDNLITSLVHKKISSEVKVGDIVLIDYRPMSSTLPVPKMEVTQILRGKHAKETWKIYTDRHTKLNPKSYPLVHDPQMQPTPHTYIG